jgi:phage-related baseplate assembly protein
MSAPINLSLLPPPAVIEPLDFETVFASRKAAVIALMPAADRAATSAMLQLESEPSVKLLQENAYRELLLRNRMNDAAKAVMLPYARGSDLEQIGANTNVPRLVVAPAKPDARPPTPEIKEDDDPYRLRIQEAPDGLSVAGPRNAYEFHARSADGRVKDVKAYSPAPCEIVVVVLSTEADGIAAPDLLARVDAALSAEDIRPLGDLVSVRSAEVVPYQVRATLYVDKGPEAPLALAAAKTNATKLEKPRRPLAWSIYRAAWIGAMKVEGVRNVVLHSPTADLLLDRTKAARCTGVQIEVKVMDDA